MLFCLSLRRFNRHQFGSHVTYLRKKRRFVLTYRVLGIERLVAQFVRINPGVFGVRKQVSHAKIITYSRSMLQQLDLPRYQQAGSAERGRYPHPSGAARRPSAVCSSRIQASTLELLRDPGQLLLASGS